MGNIDWMDIDSAPKDGTPVLLYGDGEGLPNFCVGWYEDVAGMVPETAEQGWWSCDVHNPTHWAEINPPGDA